MPSLMAPLQAINRLLGICYTETNQQLSPHLTAKKTAHHTAAGDNYGAAESPLFTRYAQPYMLADLFALHKHQIQAADTHEQSNTGKGAGGGANSNPGAGLAETIGDKEFWKTQGKKELNRRIKPVMNVEEKQIEMVQHHFMSLHYLAMESYEEARQEQHKTLSCFLDTLETASDNLMIPLLHRLCYNYYFVALAVKKCSKASQPPTKKVKTGKGSDEEDIMNTLGNSLRHGIAQCSNHKSPELFKNKRWGALRVINLLFKVAFKINNQRLGNHAMQVIKSPRFPAIHKFPLPDRITYHYYNGKFKMLKNEYGPADESLTYALKNTSRPTEAEKESETYARKEKRIKLILNALVPIKLYRGFVVDSKFLKTHDCEHYIPLVESLKTGDMSVYDRAMEEHQSLYIRAGVYLTLCHLKKYVWRRTVRRVVTLVGGDKIDLEYFHRAFCFATKRDIELEEVECILANLIYDVRQATS